MALTGAWLSRGFRGMRCEVEAGPWVFHGLSRTLSAASGTARPEQGISRVSNLLAQAVVPFRKDVLPVAPDTSF